MKSSRLSATVPLITRLALSEACIGPSRVVTGPSDGSSEAGGVGISNGSGKKKQRGGWREKE